MKAEVACTSPLFISSTLGGKAPRQGFRILKACGTPTEHIGGYDRVKA